MTVAPSSAEMAAVADIVDALHEIFDAVGIGLGRGQRPPGSLSAAEMAAVETLVRLRGPLSDDPGRLCGPLSDDPGRLCGPLSDDPGRLRADPGRSGRSGCALAASAGL